MATATQGLTSNVTSTSAFRIGVTQFELRAETSVESLLAHMEALVVAAVSQGAEAVVFPELASTGLLGAIPDHTVTSATLNDDYDTFLAAALDDIVAGLRRIAADHAVVLLGGSHNRLHHDGSRRNTAYLVRPDGHVETQDKLHLTPPELAMGACGGDDLLITQIGPFTTGVLICADVQFPELARHLVANGVELILCPSLTWNRRGVFRIRTGCHARAIENQLYVAMSPLIGSSGLPGDHPLHTFGQALVTGPVDRIVGRNDGVLALAEGAEEQVIVVDLDRDLLLRSRETPEVPGLKLRRPDLYARLAAAREPR